METEYYFNYALETKFYFNYALEPEFYFNYALETEFYFNYADVAELADAQASGACPRKGGGGSTPLIRSK